MKKTIAAFGWLMLASASIGQAGQHSGVGGTPFVPPPATPGENSSVMTQSIFQPLLDLLFFELAPAPIEALESMDSVETSKEENIDRR